MPSSADINLAVLAFIFPPAAIWIRCGFCTKESFHNVCLCLLLWLPGFIHVGYILARTSTAHPHPSCQCPCRRAGADLEACAEHRVVYHYVQTSQPPPPPEQWQARSLASVSAETGGQQQVPPRYSQEVMRTGPVRVLGTWKA